MPFAAKAAARVFANPLRYVTGKPLERWLMVVDLPRQKLALANDPTVVETVMLDRAGNFPRARLSIERAMCPAAARAATDCRPVASSSRSNCASSATSAPFAIARIVAQRVPRRDALLDADAR